MWKKFLFFIFIGLLISSSCKQSKYSADKVTKVQALAINDSIQWPWRGITVLNHSNHEIVDSIAISNLAKSGVNLIRIRLSFRKFAENNKCSDEESWKRTVKWAKNVIYFCELNKLDVVISHSDFPLSVESKLDQHKRAFWDSEEEKEKVLKDIRRIVNLFDQYSNVKAFEFIAEPVIQENGESYRPENWFEFFGKILKVVREKSSKFLLFSPGPWANADGYESMQKPFADEKIIYNFHFYDPHRYTHQGTKNIPVQYSYPGKINMRYWNRSALAKKIDLVSSWANENNVKYVFAGEFSCVRMADGRDEYLKDVIELFEERNIAWAYFSFNGWKGWDMSFEKPSKNKRSVDDLVVKKNNTQSLLNSFWALNLKDE